VPSLLDVANAGDMASLLRLRPRGVLPLYILTSEPSFTWSTVVRTENLIRTGERIA
jgi:hypothetical protein